MKGTTQNNGFSAGVAKIVLAIASTLYLAIGLAIVASSAAFFLTFLKSVVPPLYAGASMGVGVVISFIAILGFYATCKQGKGSLGLFMLLDLIVFFIVAIMTALVFEFQRVMDLASQSTEVIGVLSEVELAAFGVIKTMITKVLGTHGCDFSVEPLINEGMNYFSFQCMDTDFAPLAGAINTACLGATSYVNNTISSPFYDCYTAESWTPAAGATPAGSPLDIDVIGSPKGIFCECSTQMVDFVEPYLGPLKYVAIGVICFFALVFIACAYLCCHKKKELPKKSPEFQNIADVELAKP